MFKIYICSATALSFTVYQASPNDTVRACLQRFVRNRLLNTREITFQFRNQSLTAHDPTLLRDIDGLVDGSVIYAFKPLKPKVLVERINYIDFVFERRNDHKFYQVPSSTPISKLISFFCRFLEKENTGPQRSDPLTFQFGDKVLYTTLHGFGEGFSDTTEVRDVPGLKDDCSVYVFKSNS